MRRTRRVRVAQAEVLLRDEFPPPAPVRVVWVEKIEDPDDTRGRGFYGQAVPRGRGWEIRLSLRACRTISEALETLLHEWAHVLEPALTTDQVEHPPRYWPVYGAIYSRIFDRGGLDELRGYHRIRSASATRAPRRPRRSRPTTRARARRGRARSAPG